MDGDDFDADETHFLISLSKIASYKWFFGKPQKLGSLVFDYGLSTNTQELETANLYYIRNSFLLISLSNYICN
jgi:hypothetical protein